MLKYTTNKQVLLAARGETHDKLEKNHGICIQGYAEKLCQAI